MSSGVAVDSDCINEFQQMKTKKKFQWMVFKISDDKKSIVIKNINDGAKGQEKCKGQDFEAEYAEFQKYVMENKDEPMYAIYDFEYKTKKENQDRSKLLFFFICFDTCGIKHKMLYASSKDALAKKLDIQIKVEVNDEDDLSYSNVMEQASRNDFA